MKLGKLLKRGLESNNDWQDDSLFRCAITCMRLRNILTLRQYSDMEDLLGYRLRREKVCEVENGEEYSYLVDGEDKDAFSPKELSSVLIEMLLSEGALRAYGKTGQLPAVIRILDDVPCQRLIKKSMYLEKIGTVAYELNGKVFYLCITEYDTYRLKVVNLADVGGTFRPRHSGRVLAEGLSDQIYILRRSGKVLVKYKHCSAYYSYDSKTGQGKTVNNRMLLGITSKGGMVYEENGSIFVHMDGKDEEPPACLVEQVVPQVSYRVDNEYLQVSAKENFYGDFFISYKINISTGEKIETPEESATLFWEDVLDQADSRYFNWRRLVHDGLYEYRVRKCPDQLTLTEIRKKISWLRKEKLLSDRYSERIFLLLDILKRAGFGKDEDLSLPISRIMHYFRRISPDLKEGHFTETACNSLNLAIQEVNRTNLKRMIEKDTEILLYPYLECKGKWLQRQKKLIESQETEYDSSFIGHLDLLLDGTVRFYPQTMVHLCEGIVLNGKIHTPADANGCNGRVFFDLGNDCFRLALPLGIPIQKGEKQRILEMFGLTRYQLFDENTLPEW